MALVSDASFPEDYSSLAVGALLLQLTSRLHTSPVRKSSLMKSEGSRESFSFFAMDMRRGRWTFFLLDRPPWILYGSGPASLPYPFRSSFGSRISFFPVRSTLFSLHPDILGTVPWPAIGPFPFRPWIPPKKSSFSVLRR